MFGTKKPDGVVEAVRYGSDGKIKWVRMYERRGPMYSDHILVDRAALIERLKSGQQILSGERIPLLAGTFKTAMPLRVIQFQGNEFVVTGEIQSDHDQLTGVPVI